MSSLPTTVTRQRRDCDLNPGPSAPESSKLTTRLNEVITAFYGIVSYNRVLQCFDAVGWVAGRASGL